jgi:hypothetical protein
LTHLLKPQDYCKEKDIVYRELNELAYMLTNYSWGMNYLIANYCEKVFHYINLSALSMFVGIMLIFVA